MRDKEQKGQQAQTAPGSPVAKKTKTQLPPPGSPVAKKTKTQLPPPGSPGSVSSEGSVEVERIFRNFTIGSERRGRHSANAMFDSSLVAADTKSEFNSTSDPESESDTAATEFRPYHTATSLSRPVPERDSEVVAAVTSNKRRLEATEEIKSEVAVADINIKENNSSAYNSPASAKAGNKFKRRYEECDQPETRKGRRLFPPIASRNQAVTPSASQLSAGPASVAPSGVSSDHPRAMSRNSLISSPASFFGGRPLSGLSASSSTPVSSAEDSGMELELAANLSPPPDSAASAVGNSPAPQPFQFGIPSHVQQVIDNSWAQIKAEEDAGDGAVDMEKWEEDDQGYDSEDIDLGRPYPRQ